MKKDESTICAIATPPGNGAIAIIRISGKGAISIAESVFKTPGKNKNLSQQKSFTVHYGNIHEKGNLIDEVLVSVFKSPHSYTGDDTVEISCHGSSYIQQKILELLVNQGARLANPGEFTQRAFLNGKMDLSQAEAVADLIASSSEASHKMAINQMRGGFSGEISELRRQLLDFVSLIELELDFSEEDVEFANRNELEKLVESIQQNVNKLIQSFSTGNALKKGIPVAIIGKPNVGKSTLLNTLLNEEKAIVSEIPGTTRDYIEDIMILNGISFRFIDTAGLRDTKDRIETLGIEKTHERIKQASIILYLIDAHDNTSNFKNILHTVKNLIKEENEYQSKKVIYLLNKIDTFDDFSEHPVYEYFEEDDTVLTISAKKKLHIDSLIDELIASAHVKKNLNGDVIVNNMRHYEALKHTSEALHRVINGLEEQIASDLLAQDMREAIHYLGEITGEISTDEILGNIFKNFCIGK